MQPSDTTVTVAAERCAGCQECVVRCPEQALTLDPRSWTVTTDSSLCSGCRQCERLCPFGAIHVLGPAKVSPGVRRPAHAVLSTWEAAIAEASRCLNCPDPTCRLGCPAHNDIPSFVAAVGRGDLQEAHRVLRGTSVLPDVCSRVCDQQIQCEATCSWTLAGQSPVAIGQLERFVCDNAPAPPPTITAGRGRTLDVVVVGSGPAGAAAAWELAEAGATVTVLERDEVPGGLLRWGIPDFILPEVVWQRPWQALEAAGVRVHCRTTVRHEHLGALQAAHDAVVLAFGASAPRRRRVPGDTLGGVHDAAWFLREGTALAARGGHLDALLSGWRLRPGRVPTVLVVGAGNTGIDVARTARRLGAKVICTGRREQEETPVRVDQLAAAVAEGVSLRYRAAVTALEGKGGWVRTAVLVRTTPDGDPLRGRARRRSQLREPVDLVVMAQGSALDPEWAEQLPSLQREPRRQTPPPAEWIGSGLFGPSGADITPIGLRALRREAGVERAALPVHERVWLCGDALTGPGTVVEAMAQGKRVAEAILDAQPSRRAPRPMGRSPRALVVFDEQYPAAVLLAREVGDGLRTAGLSVQLRPVLSAGVADVAVADLVVLAAGLARSRRRGPSRAARAWLTSLPPLHGQRFAIAGLPGSRRRAARGSQFLRDELESRAASLVPVAAVEELTAVWQGPPGSRVRPAPQPHPPATADDLQQELNEGA